MSSATGRVAARVCQAANCWPKEASPPAARGESAAGASGGPRPGSRREAPRAWSLPAGAPQHGFDGLGAQTPRGRVQDAHQTDLVGRVVDETQVGDEILDLATAVEALGADETVRQIGVEKSFLEGPRLGVGAVHDGTLARLQLMLEGQRGDRLDDVGRLLLLVVGFPQDDLRALAAVGEEALLLAIGMAIDDRH